MSLKLLIVDDELDALEGVRFFFESRGVEVLTAQGGLEALALVKACHPQVIMLDIKMKGMSGIEILQKAKELDPSVAVVMITGLSEDGLEEACQSLGATAFLEKPVRVEQLEQVIHTLNANPSLKSSGR